MSPESTSCPECEHQLSAFLPNVHYITKADYYNGVTVIEKSDNQLVVLYKWNDFVTGDELPEGADISENYNCNGEANYAYYTDSQGCKDYGDDEHISLCPSGVFPFRGLISTPTNQSAAVANINSSLPTSKYDVTDILSIGVQEWVLLPNDNFNDFGTIAGHGKFSNSYAKHEGLHTRGPRLGFRWCAICDTSEEACPQCIQCPQIGIVECFAEVDDTGSLEYYRSDDTESANPIYIPKIREDKYGNGYVNKGFSIKYNLVNNGMYTRFLNTIAVNDYYSDLILWHHSMMPNISRTEHSDPIHKYSYSCDPRAYNLPVTNVNLFGAMYFVKWINAYFCIPFRYSQQQLDQDENLSNCEQCLDDIDNARYSPPTY